MENSGPGTVLFSVFKLYTAYFATEIDDQFANLQQQRQTNYCHILPPIYSSLGN